MDPSQLKRTHRSKGLLSYKEPIQRVIPAPSGRSPVAQCYLRLSIHTTVENVHPLQAIEVVYLVKDSQFHIPRTQMIQV